MRSTNANNSGNNLQERTNEQAKKRKRTSLPRIIDSESPFYAIEKVVDDNVEVRCKECNKIRKGNLNSTGNFIAHYKKKHEKLLNKLTAYLKPVDVRKSIEFNDEPASKEQVSSYVKFIIIQCSFDRIYRSQHV